MSDLHLCNQCDRHVFSGEEACPFCQAPLSERVTKPAAVGRMTRAAIFAGSLAAAGCSGGDGDKADARVADDADQSVPDAGVGVVDANTNVPDAFLPMPYGAPPARRRLV